MAHFYTLLTGVCASCGADSPDSRMSGLFCVTLFRAMGYTPCDACASIPAHFAAETIPPTMLLVYTSFDYPCRTHQYGIWQSNDVYFVVIYYAIPAYYPELELQIVFLSGFNANHLYKAKSRKAWIIHRCLAVSLYLQMCYFREWSLTGQPTNIADDEH